MLNWMNVPWQLRTTFVEQLLQSSMCQTYNYSEMELSYGSVSHKNKSITSSQFFTKQMSTVKHLYLAMLASALASASLMIGKTLPFYFQIWLGASQPSPPPELRVKDGVNLPWSSCRESHSKNSETGNSESSADSGHQQNI